MPIIEVVQSTAPAGTRITKLAFLTRFTDAEAVAIDLASIGATEQAASIRRYLNLVDAAAFIDLARPDLHTSLSALETVGLLSAGRADAIINTPIQPIEVPAK